MTYLFQQTINQAKLQILSEPEKIKDLFYDWFCSDKSLKNRATKLMNKADFIISQLGINQDKTKLTFKHNSPLYGDLYDSFFIDSIDDKIRLYIVPSYGHAVIKRQAEITVISYYDEGPKEEFTKMFCNWSELKKQIKNDESLRNLIRAYFEEK